MKLLYCPACGDLFGLRSLEVRACKCGSAKGAYLARLEAAHNGNGVPIILNTFDFRDAIRRVKTKGIPKNTIGFQIRCGTAAPFNLNIRAVSDAELEKLVARAIAAGVEAEAEEVS